MKGISVGTVSGNCGGRFSFYGLYGWSEKGGVYVGFWLGEKGRFCFGKTLVL